MESHESVVCKNDVTDAFPDEVQDKRPGKVLTNTRTIQSRSIPSLQGKEKGYMLVIVNETCGIHGEREGAQKDFQNIKEIGEHLGFQILNKDSYMNLTKDETSEWLKIASEADHTACERFMIVVSSHGNEETNEERGKVKEHAFYCADSKPYFTNTMIEMFNKCDTLEGKPKIFIMQACRGQNPDAGVEVPNTSGMSSGTKKDESDTTTHARDDIPDTKPDLDSWNEEIPYFKSYNDMLVVFATSPGFYAWRNKSQGSWLIHYLHGALMTNRTPSNFLQVLTEVAGRMSEREFTLKQLKCVPVICHMLRSPIPI